MTQAPSCLDLSPLSPAGRPEIREKEVELEGGEEWVVGWTASPLKLFHYISLRACFAFFTISSPCLSATVFHPLSSSVSVVHLSPLQPGPLD